MTRRLALLVVRCLLRLRLLERADHSRVELPESDDDTTALDPQPESRGR